MQKYNLLLNSKLSLLFGNLANFHLGTWLDFIWELGEKSFGELADGAPLISAVS